MAATPKITNGDKTGQHVPVNTAPNAQAVPSRLPFDQSGREHHVLQRNGEWAGELEGGFWQDGWGGV